MKNRDKVFYVFLALATFIPLVIFLSGYSNNAFLAQFGIIGLFIIVILLDLNISKFNKWLNKK